MEARVLKHTGKGRHSCMTTVASSSLIWSLVMGPDKFVNKLQTDQIWYTCQRKRNDLVQNVPVPLYLANGTLHMNPDASNLLRGYNLILSQRCSCRCAESRDVQQNAVFCQLILDIKSPSAMMLYPAGTSSSLTRRMPRASNPDNLCEFYLLLIRFDSGVL